MQHAFQLGQHRLGPAGPVLIIAEAGVNHNGNLELAHWMVEAAANAGADVVKFQCFRAGEIISRHAAKARYQQNTTDPAESQLAMVRALELPLAAWRELQQHCLERGCEFLATPFDASGLDLLDGLDVPGFKISSTDTTNLPFLKQIAAKRRPVILSTGMCELAEVRRAVEILATHGIEKLALMHCTSEYPAPIVESNLRALGTMAAEFQVPVGFSDHTDGIEAAPLAVAVGACLVEKHFTLDRNLPGPDHRASLEPEALRSLVQAIRRTETVLGDGIKRPSASELANRAVVRRSLTAKVAIPAGTRIQPEMLACKRPGTGLAPEMWDSVLGQLTARNIQEDETLTADCIAWRLGAGH